MAERVEVFTITCPANRAIATPLETSCSFNPGVVEALEIVIADGHAGQTGIALALAHQPIIPDTRGGFITSNDEVIRWPLDSFPNTGAWSAFTYNLDATNAHNWFLRFLINEIRDTGHSILAQPLDLNAIYSAANQTGVIQAA